jgi:hypothetical protein
MTGTIANELRGRQVRAAAPAIQQLIGHFILCNYCTNQSNFSFKLVAE